jgi:hypothetical protein
MRLAPTFLTFAAGQGKIVKAFGETKAVDLSRSIIGISSSTPTSSCSACGGCSARAGVLTPAAERQSTTWGHGSRLFRVGIGGRMPAFSTSSTSIVRDISASWIIGLTGKTYGAGAEPVWRGQIGIHYGLSQSPSI